MERLDAAWAFGKGCSSSPDPDVLSREGRACGDGEAEARRELKAGQKRRGYLLKRCFLGIQPINLVTPLAARWTVPARPQMQLVAVECVCIRPAQRMRDPPQQEGFL